MQGTVIPRGAVRTLVEIISSTPRMLMSGCCKARFAGNSGTIAKKRNAAAAAHEQPDVEIISTRVLNNQVNEHRRKRRNAAIGQKDNF